MAPSGTPYTRADRCRSKFLVGERRKAFDELDRRDGPSAGMEKWIFGGRLPASAVRSHRQCIKHLSIAERRSVDSAVDSGNTDACAIRSRAIRDLLRRAVTDRRASDDQCASALISNTPSSTHPRRTAPTTICLRSKNVSIFTPRTRQRGKERTSTGPEAISCEQRYLWPGQEAAYRNDGQNR